MLRMKKFEIPAHNVCPHCGHEELECSGCHKMYEYCPDCGEELKLPETFLVFTHDKYRGIGEFSQETVNLMIDGTNFATARISIDESDTGADVAYLWLCSPATWSTEEEMSETTAKIIAEFAKWIRFDWRSPDMQSKFPTLVRLQGTKVHKNRPMGHPNYFEEFFALMDATKIGVKHLARDYTWVEVL